MSFPFADKLMDCVNCGTCTASCGSKDFMEYGPRGIIRGIITGNIEEVRASLDPWHCIQCFMCEIKCPRDVKPVYVMRALKEIELEDDGYSEIAKKVHSAKKLQKIFVNQIKKNGRISEFQTALAYKGILGSMKELDIGIKLLRTNRLKLKTMIKYGITFGTASDIRMPNEHAREQVRRLMEKFYSVNV
jgi:heterodisulfide reductase subunit C